MRSRAMLVLHTAIFLSFATASLSSPFVLMRDPQFFSSPYVLVGVAVVAAAVIISWPVFGGCPLTVWENRFRKAEGRRAYRGPCIDHYTYQWFGLKLPGSLSTIILVVLLLLPSAAILFSKFGS